MDYGIYKGITLKKALFPIIFPKSLYLLDLLWYPEKEVLLVWYHF